MNSIEQISVGAFKDQENLIHLYLKQNKLTRIEVGTFDTLTEFGAFVVAEQSIILIEKGLFDKNVNLEYLYLNENKISMIAPTVLKNMNNIKQIHLHGNLCSNRNFKTNKIDPNFTCFKSFASLLKPHLDQCKTETENCEARLNENASKLISVGKNLSDCQREISNISEKIERQPKSGFIIIAIAGLVIFLIIALLISIVKVYRLANNNKFLNENLDRLCKDNVYEKVN
jgi:hypothetical protein